MQFLEVFSLVNLLIAAPVDCQELERAVRSFKTLCRLRDPSRDQMRMIAVFRAALRARFDANGISLRQLAELIGTCGAFRLFLNDVMLGDNDTVVGSTLEVNVFATSHIAKCSECHLVFVAENFHKATMVTDRAARHLSC